MTARQRRVSIAMRPSRDGNFHFTPLCFRIRTPHTLTIAYSGAIPRQRKSGVSHGDYATAAGTQRMLVTQFEPLDARRMFPVGLRLKHSRRDVRLSIGAASDLAAVSNTPP